MSKILGYGEDALTFTAITKRLPEFLKALHDETDPEDALVIYRPSFGRRAANRTGTVQKQRAEFGEFDAIVATTRAIYLVESKWHGSRGIKDGVIALRGEQARRHQIFAWYLRMWHGRASDLWGDFVHTNESAFTQDFGPTCMSASPDSLLTRNLRCLLDQLVPISRNVVDVLLYFGQDGKTMPVSVEADPVVNFELVPMTYQSIGECGFFDMS